MRDYLRNLHVQKRTHGNYLARRFAQDSESNPQHDRQVSYSSAMTQPEHRFVSIADSRELKLADIAVFNKVAATLSFKHAGDLLGLSRTAVSRRISGLEKDVAVRLFHRSARSIQLTPAGERFYSHTATLNETLHRAGQAIREARDAPFGTLAFTMPTSLGALFDVPQLPRSPT